MQERAAAEPPAPGTNVSLRQDFLDQLNERRKLYRDPEKDYCMLPSHFLTIPQLAVRLRARADVLT